MTTMQSPDSLPSAQTNLLYRRYASLVRRWALQLTRSPADAEDVVQEVFLVAHRRLSETELRNPGLWLFRVTHNVARHLWRDRRRRNPVQLDHVAELADGSPGPCEVLEHRVDLLRLGQALRRLEPRDRRLVYLCDVRRLPTARVTDLTGINAQTLRVRRHRARRRIARWLHQIDVGGANRIFPQQM
jgi:RNA polymerase sigma factor (sigma-70 family)